MGTNPKKVLSAAALIVALAAGAVASAQAQTGGSEGSGGITQGGSGGMMGRGGMMSQREMINLRNLPPERSVQAVRYCQGQYMVSTAAGDVLEFAEFNLRMKTDASDKGPALGKPALLPAGMMGDRAYLVFSDPTEISRSIEKKC